VQSILFAGNEVKQTRNFTFFARLSLSPFPLCQVPKEVWQVSFYLSHTWSVSYITMQLNACNVLLQVFLKWKNSSLEDSLDQIRSPKDIQVTKHLRNAALNFITCCHSSTNRSIPCLHPAAGLIVIHDNGNQLSKTNQLSVYQAILCN